MLPDVPRLGLNQKDGSNYVLEGWPSVLRKQETEQSGYALQSTFRGETSQNDDDE